MQMLLLEGDDMNQKTGICILLCLVLLLVFGIWYQKRGVENTKNTQEQYASETEHTVLTGTPYKETENAYIIRTQDSRLVVFLPDGKTVYMETGIRSENLSQKLQKQAENGIGFADEESLFDFLESYSSLIFYTHMIKYITGLTDKMTGGLWIRKNQNNRKCS